MKRTIIFCLCVMHFGAASLRADAPVSSYLFPAGGQRGTQVEVLVGGLNLNASCNFEMLGPGVSARAVVKRTTGPVFEGPLLPLPESQRQEDYPRTMAARIKIAADAASGSRYARLWTAQGVTLPLPFVVGDLPEIVEKEIDGTPIPVLVDLPLTVNGRIYPRENVDSWIVRLKKTQTLSCSVAAASLGSPLEARLSVHDPKGRKVLESGEGLRIDPTLRFTAELDGEYQIQITDVRGEGGPAFVYRLTLSTGPTVDRVFPLGGRRGETTRFQLFGSGVPTEPIAILIPRQAGAALNARWEHTNEFHLDVDDLREVFEPAPATLAAPFIGNGVISTPGEMDAWNFEASKGEEFDIDLRAFRLGSPLLGMLTVRDGAGHALATAEASDKGDPSLHFTTPLSGKFAIEVKDRFSTRGGPAFAYRLRIERAQPDFSLQASLTSLTIPRSGQAQLKITASRRGNLNGPIYLHVDGLPTGVRVVKDSVIPANQASIDLTLAADPTARVESFPLRISGFTLMPVLSYAIHPLIMVRQATCRQGEGEFDHLRAAIALPTPFKIAGDYTSALVPRGTVYSRMFRIERNGFKGPIEIDMADRQARHLQGVTGPRLTVPADATEFIYPVQLPPWMETGRTCRVCVMGTATIKDGDHVVTYSSREQNDQIITVVEPERLTLQLDKSTVRVEPGGQVEIGFKIGRAEGLNGAVKIDLVLPAHFRGIEAKVTEIPAGAHSGKLQVRFATDASGPFNMPLVVRAVANERGWPVNAEAKMELIAGK